MKTKGKADSAEQLLMDMLPEELREKKSVMLTVSKKSIRLFVLINTFRPLLTLLIVFALSAYTTLAQGTNPFPTRGDQSLGNLVSGGLKIASYFALAVGLGSFMIIPVKLFMKSEWMNFLWAGLFGVGGWAAAGSLAYMLANNQDIELENLDI
jgi:hypothetical protein